MKAETALRLIGVLRAAYPGRELDESTATIYTALLADLDDETAERAVLLLCRTQKFFPSVAEIIAAAAAHRDPLPTAAGAWEGILQAIRLGDHRKPVLARRVTFHALVAEALAGVGGLRAVAETDQIETTRAHFFHRYAESVDGRRRMHAELGAPKSLEDLAQRMKAAMPAGALLGRAAAGLLGQPSSEHDPFPPRKRGS